MMLREISANDAKQAAYDGKTVYRIDKLLQSDGSMYNVTDRYDNLFPAEGRYLVDDPEIEEPKPEVKNRDPKPSKGRPKIDSGKLIALHNAGWSNKAIADEMGISLQTVYNYIKEVQDGKKE